MQKKILAALLAVVMLTGVTACGKGNETYTELMEDLKSEVTTLGTYKDLTYTMETATITDEEVEEEIQAELEWYSEYEEVTDRTIVEDGDVVNINFVGSVDGEEFEGGTAQDYDLEIGSGDFIEGFEEQIVGKEKGSTFDVNVTFPEDYEEGLSGKDAVFKVTVNKIQKSVAAELTDEFVQENMECETVEEYRTKVKEDLLTSLQDENKTTAIYEVLDQIIASSEMKIEDADVEAYIDSMIGEYTAYAEMYGMEKEEFINNFFGGTEEELRAESVEEAKNEITYSLILSAIAKKENLGITQEEYEAKVTGYLEEYEVESIEQYEEEYGKSDVIYELLYEKVTQYLLDNSTNTAK